jgi:hypothetical protein
MSVIPKWNRTMFDIRFPPIFLKQRQIYFRVKFWRIVTTVSERTLSPFSSYLHHRPSIIIVTTTVGMKTRSSTHPLCIHTRRKGSCLSAAACIVRTSRSRWCRASGRSAGTPRLSRWGMLQTCQIQIQTHTAKDVSQDTQVVTFSSGALPLGRLRASRA